MKAQKKRDKEFLEEQDRKDEWERVLTGKKREQEISIAELKGIGPLGDFWQSYLGKSSDQGCPPRSVGRPARWNPHRSLKVKNSKKHY